MSNHVNKKPTISYTRPNGDTTEAQRDLVFQIASIISKWQALHLMTKTDKTAERQFALKLEKSICESDYDAFSMTCEAVRKIFSFYCEGVANVVSLRVYKHSNRDMILVKSTIKKDFGTYYSTMRIDFNIAVCAESTFKRAKNKVVCIEKRAI